MKLWKIFALIVLGFLQVYVIMWYINSKDTVIKKERANVVTPVFGIDVSHHQGDIDWSLVDSFRANPIQFAYVKATEGETHLDDMLYKNFFSAQAKGLSVGTYHYFKTTSGPLEQFYNYSEAIDELNQDLIPMVDVEERGNISDEDFHYNLQLLLDLLEEKFGKKPLIYTGNSFYDDYLSDKYKNYYFCIAHYSQVPVCGDSTEWTMWQFTDEAYIKGVDERVDINVINPEYEFENLKL